MPETQTLTGPQGPSPACRYTGGVVEEAVAGVDDGGWHDKGRRQCWCIIATPVEAGDRGGGLVDVAGQ